MKINVRVAIVLRIAALTLLCSLSVPASAAKTATQPDPYMEENRREQQNIRIVTAFYQALAKFDLEAMRLYIGDHYTQHNPTIEDGFAGLEKAVTRGKQQLGPKATNIVDHKLIVADGEYVILLSHGKTVTDDLLGNDLPNRGNAIADIFRLEDGKIVEHWDTIEAIPEKIRNSNGVF
jgi:predicted SnoaL-like aldol condensation-catalyzing enzyme